MSSLDYLDLCRLCLVKDRVSVPIFEGEGDVRQIFLKITACLPVKVNKEDKLPKKICDDCVYKIELCYQFWHTTANAEKQLLQWLGEVNMEDKQGYVLNPNGMKPEHSNENRLDGTVMQQVSEHQNNMNMGMMDSMGLGMPIMISSNTQQQITSVPMDNSGSSIQNVQPVAGPSMQTTHDQITQNQTDAPTQQEEEEESSEEEENSDDECDGDEGLPIKEEGEEDPNNSRTIEPTTFVNVSLACDEAGPSGLQQQKIADMPEMVMPQTADVDPKTGLIDLVKTELIDIDEIKIEDVQQSCVFDVALSSRVAEISSIENNEENDIIRTLCYTCDICSFPFQSKNDLKKHMEVHVNTCRICKELFPSSDKLEDHLIMHHGEPKYSCTLCDDIAWNKIDIMRHFFTVHMDPFCNVCSPCNKKFQTKYAIDRHMYSKHSKLCVACTTCKRTYNTIALLESHIKFVHLQSGYKCQICKKRTQTWKGMEIHMRRHEHKHREPYLHLNVCTTCGETFPSKDSLRKHMPIHGELNPYICPVCLKAFNKRAYQVQHILTHMDHVYKCHICGVAYSRRSALIAHMKRHPFVSRYLPIMPVIGIVSEFVRNYFKNIKKSSNFLNFESNVHV